MGAWLVRLWELLRGTELRVGLLWLTLAGLGVALVVLVTTRWGRSRPLEKCLVLSLMVHVWLAVYSTTVTIVTVAAAPGEGETMRVSLDAGVPLGKEDASGPAGDTKPWEVLVHETPQLPKPAELARASVPETPLPERQVPLSETSPQSPPEPLHPAELLPVEPPSTMPESDETGQRGSTAESQASPTIPTTIVGAAQTAISRVREPIASPSAIEIPTAPGEWQRATRTPYSMPAIYRLRVAPDRAERAQQRGGANVETEAAVQAALKWLADNQEPDGRWSPARHGAGQETREAGRDRFGAGSTADTGITALAILAFTARGNTHLDGPYKTAVRAGLNYLLSVQASDGHLAGRAQVYEFMYCHGMATLALGELLGMSGDPALREPLRRAVAYTLAAQDPIGGGWRYRMRESGDTSQLGWQLMALKSAELAGIAVPASTWQGASRFLESVSSGNARGLACYRPGERVSRTMTAEALVCRIFLGLSPESPIAQEAGEHLLAECPGEGDGNLYYWYYGTMAMHQLQGRFWTAWTAALQRTLLARQRTTGPLAGSWDPVTRWDGYGGRVYATALAALCLEAYYRFLPLHGSGEALETARH